MGMKGTLCGIVVLTNVWQPKVRQSVQFTFSQIERNSIEAGWQVDGYKTCCYNFLYEGYVQVSWKLGLDSALERASTYNGTEYEISFSIVKDVVSSNWLLLWGQEHELIGYWPKKLFNCLRDKAEDGDWEGKTYGPNPLSNYAVTTLGGTLISFSHSITALFILVSLIFIAQLRSRIQKKTRPAPLPPGPAPWPIVGSILELFRKKPVFRWILGLMKEMNTEIACFRFGDIHVIPVTCPEIAREFLKKQDATFASRPITMGTEYPSRGFLSVALTPWGDQWKKMRRVVASEVINRTRIQWLLEKRTEEADNLVHYVYNQCTSGTSVVDVRVAARQYTGNVIRKMIFGKRYFGEGRKDGGPGFEEEEYVDALFVVLSLLYSFCVSDYIPTLRRFDLNGHEKIMKEATRVVNKYHDPIIDERIREWREGKKNEAQDLLDIFISMNDSNGKPLLCTEEIKAQVAELFYASVDNPSNAVEWALAEMINQPEMLRKATEEIDQVIGKERLVQESDIPHLNYVKACAREAFRLHPIVPFNLPHVSNADTTVAGFSIPKGSHVILSRVGLGRNPKVWDDPLTFKPERHLKDPSIEVDLVEPELRFISFSTGRRGCMGVALGSVMTIMLLARLLQGFSWGIIPGESRIELNESKTDLFLAKPLLAHAKPRLPVHAYPMH